MADANLEVLYFAPSDTRRSSVAHFAQGYVRALEGGLADAKQGRIDVVPVLDPSIPETESGHTVPIATVKSLTSERLKARGESEGQLLHAEIGPRTAREFWAAFHAARLLPARPLCLTFHDPPNFPPFVNEIPVSPTASFFDRLLTHTTAGLSRLGRGGVEASFLDRATALFALSRRAADLLASKHPRHASRIVRLPPFNLGAIPEKAEPNVRRLGEAIIVTCLDFIHSATGILQVLDALLLVHRQCPIAGRVQFRICGTPSDQAAADGTLDRIRDYIRATGSLWLAEFVPKALSETQVDQMLQETDVLVLPYLPGECESTSKTLMRAQTWAVAVVASDTGCMRELVSDGHDGILYRPRDVKSLAEALKRVIENQDLRTNLARAQRARAVKERLTSRLAERMIEVYLDVLGAKAEGRAPKTAWVESGEADER